EPKPAIVPSGCRYRGDGGSPESFSGVVQPAGWTASADIERGAQRCETERAGWYGWDRDGGLRWATGGGHGGSSSWGWYRGCWVGRRRSGRARATLLSRSVGRPRVVLFRRGRWPGCSRSSVSFVRRTEPPEF